MALVVMGVGVALFTVQAERAWDDLATGAMSVDELSAMYDADRRLDASVVFVTLTALGVGAFLASRIREASLRVPRAPALVGAAGLALLWGTRPTILVGGIVLAVAAVLWLRWLRRSSS